MHCTVGIRNLGPSGSDVVGPQGPISRQSMHWHISGDSSRMSGPIFPGQDPDFDQQHTETLCMCADARGGHTMYWFSSLDNVVCMRSVCLSCEIVTFDT